MKYTKSALGLLNNQCKSVLKKCLLINLGLFALGTTGANATTVIIPQPKADSVWSLVNDENLMSINQYTVNEATGEITATTTKYLHANIGSGESVRNYSFDYAKWDSDTKRLVPATADDYDVISLIESTGSGDVVVHYDTSDQHSRVNNTTDRSGETITGNFINANGTTNYANGGSIYNKGSNAKLGNITADFVDNYAYVYKEGNASVYGGGIYSFSSVVIGDISFSSAVGDIVGDFVKNYAYSYGGNGAYAYAHGGGIYSISSSIGDITGDFINNYVYANAAKAVAEGGGIFNHAATVGDINGSFIGNYAYAVSGATTSVESGGGAIYNIYPGTIGDITGDFIGNYTYSSGTPVSRSFAGAIYNYSGATIDGIVGDFIGNYSIAKSTNNYASAFGGAIYNGEYLTYRASVSNIAGDFIGNYARAFASSDGRTYAGGGAIYNTGSIIGDIVGNFIENNTYSDKSSYGGAIYNTGSSNTMGTIDSISGNFVGNYAYAVDSAMGGAIYNSTTNLHKGIIGEIVGDFIGNYAYGNSVDGGAIYNNGIVNVEGSFANNYAISTALNAGKGGAIYNNTGSLTINDAKFINNAARGSGGAIYNGSLNNIGNIYLIADSEDVIFTGNKARAEFSYDVDVTTGKLSNIQITDGSSNAIYNYNGNIYLNADENLKVVFNDAIDGCDSNNVSSINIYVNKTGMNYAVGQNGDTTIYDTMDQYGGIYEFNNDVAENKMWLYNDAQIKLGSNVQVASDTDDTEINYFGTLYLTGIENDTNGGFIDARNENYNQTHFLGLMNLNSTLDYAIDLDATNKTADVLRIDDGSSGTINITDIAFKNNVLMFDGKIRIIYNSNEDTILTLENDYETIKTLTGSDLPLESLNVTNTQIIRDAYKYDQTSRLEVVGYSDDSLLDSLQWNISYGPTYDVDEVDTLAFINMYNTTENKSFTFITDDTYELNEDAGSTIGSLTINGLSENDKSTIDFNGNDAFEISEGSSLTIVNTKLIDSSDSAQVAVSAGGELNLNGAELDIGLNNNSTVTTRNETTISHDITGNGEINNSGSLTLRDLVNDNKIFGTGETIINGEVTTNANIVTDLTIEENSVFNLSEGVSAGETIYNSGVINLFGNNTIGTINGNGITNVISEIDMSGSRIIGDTLVVQSGRLTVMSDNFSESASLEAKDTSIINITDEEISLTDAKFENGSVLELKVTSDSNGVIKAENIEIEDGAELKATLGQGITTVGKTKTVQLLEANNKEFNNFTESNDNNMYKFEKADLDGAYNISLINTAEDVASENGGTKTNQEAAKAWVDSEAFDGGIADAIADDLAGLAQNDGKGFVKSLTALAPTDAPMVQEVTIIQDDILFRTVASHLRNESIEGLASGDLGNGLSLWTRAYMGKSSLDDRGQYYGFDFDNKGIIAALEKEFTTSFKIGLGYHYDDADVDAYNKDVDVKTTKGFVYAEYKPNAWFVHGTASYGRSKYDEDKHTLGRTFGAKYSANTYAGQLLTGYELSYFTPETGLRYYNIKRHGYIDSATQTVSGKDLDVLTAVAGVRAAKDFYGINCRVFRPEAYVGVTYDLVSDRDNAVVGLANGTSYTVYGKRLNRFGVEAGAGLTAEITDNLSANVNYLGSFRQDYQSHTGMLGLKYDF